MVSKHKNYTEQEAAELDQALEAQYKADRERRSTSSEQEDWRKIRRAAAQRVFASSKDRG
jgi:hypothetical protein